MKTQNLMTGILLLLLFQLVACERNSSDISAQESATQLKEVLFSGPTSIKQGDAIHFTLNNDLSASKFRWTVSPATDVRIARHDSAVSIYFPGSGDYRVTVVDSIQSDSVSINLNVKVEGRYPNEIVSQQNFKTGDFLHLTPQIIKDSAFVSLKVETNTLYNCSDNYLAANFYSTNDSFHLNFAGVKSPTDCDDASTTSKRSFILIMKENKTYALEINFKDKTYTGTVTRNGNDYTFNWPYTSDVILGNTVLVDVANR